jgi:two-component system, cell cycle response regulator
MISESDIRAAKILIVDDQPVNVTVLEALLRGAGYTSVASTDDPRRVRELHRKHSFDLIVLDIEMPEMDGFEVMDALRDLEVDGVLPVLAVTGESGYKLRALKSGARDFVSKPFDMVEVVMRVRNLVEMRLLHAETRAYAKQIEDLALQDSLTGLANRRFIIERLRIALNGPRGASIAIAYLDLDGFKQVNDTRGHGAGDELLKEVAARLLVTVRGEDTVARLGGDEFLIALWRITEAAEAEAAVRRIIEAVDRPYVIEGKVLSITCSAGVALSAVHGVDPETLMSRADGALYAAKRAGKNQCIIADRGTNAEPGVGSRTPIAPAFRGGADRRR